MMREMMLKVHVSALLYTASPTPHVEIRKFYPSLSMITVSNSSAPSQLLQVSDIQMLARMHSKVYRSELFHSRTLFAKGHRSRSAFYFSISQ
jgi:hypothetical protein